MKKKFYSSVLAMLLSMTGTTAWAQTHISNAAELRNISDNNTDYVLDNDIDLEGNMPRKWWYSGTFDGNGHTIYNVPVTALFSATGSGVVIKNLTIENTSTLAADNGTASFVAYSRGSITFENCVNKVNMSSDGRHMVSGFIGEAHGAGSTVTFINCRNEGEITGSLWETGGFIGLDAEGVNVTFTGCMNLGDVKSNSSYGIGGFIGQAHSSGTYTFTNCGNMGTILCGSGYDEACAFIGRSSGTIALTNCWNSGQTGKYENDWQNYPLTQNGLGTFTNCYDVYNGSAGVTQIAATDVAGGALCYLLNGDQSAITFYQTLGTDQYPVLDSTHGQVYRVGQFQCDGITPKEGVEASYTNTAGTSTVDDHNFVDGVCSVCGTYNPADIDGGVYHIGTVAQMKAFRAKASSTSGALLTANIDMDGQGWQGITGYAGTFDGGGFTISNLGAPLINTTASGATVKNLTLSGSLTTTQTHFAAFVNSSVGNLTLENLTNETAITGSNQRVAGILGGVGANSTVNITNCVNNADIDINNNWIGGIVGFGYEAVQLTLTGCVNTGNITGNQAGIGGIIAQTNNYGGGLNTLINCGNTGTITNRNENHAGGIFGFVYASTSNLTNCWNIGQTIGSDGTDTQQLIAFNNSSTITYTNCYNTGGITAGVSQITTADAASGALCYLLNDGAGSTIFYQNLDNGATADAYPVLDDEHGQVYRIGQFQCDGVTPKTGVTPSYSNTEGTNVVDDHNFVDGICSVCGTYDPSQIVDGVYQIATAAQLRWFSDFVNAGNNLAKAALTADIDLENVPFSPIGRFGDNMSGNVIFYGAFDGQGHEIKNLKIESTDNWEAGLFGRASDKNGVKSSIKNLGIVNADITTNNSSNRGAALVGFNQACIIENCYVTGTISVKKGETTLDNALVGGGLSSYNSVKNCWTSYTAVGSGINASNCYAATADQMTSGELCYNINNGAGETIFYQTVDEDSYPVFDATHGKVSKMSAAGYSTFYKGTSASKFSSAVEVYTGEKKTKPTEHITLVRQDNTIPAATGVVLKAVAGSYYSVTDVASAPAITGTNSLTGSDDAVTAKGNEYVLAKKSKGVGFYPAAEGLVIPAGKAYVVDASGVKAFVFDFDDATGIEAIEHSPLTTDESIYNLAGQKMSKMQRGVNIIGGKKVMVK